MNEATEKKLLAEVEETRVLVEGVLKALVGKEKTEDYVRRVDSYLWWRRYESGTPLYKFDIQQWGKLAELDLLTLEEVAAKPRDEIEALPGVGRMTIQKLEGAMAERI